MSQSFQFEDMNELMMGSRKTNNLFDINQLSIDFDDENEDQDETFIEDTETNDFGSQNINSLAMKLK